MSMFCALCGPQEPYADELVMCPIHIVLLERSAPQPSEPDGGAPAEDPVRAEVPPAPASAPSSGRGWSTDACWNCTEPSPDRTNTECLRCRKRLVPPRLVLTFERGVVELDRGQSAELGRSGPHAALFGSFTNVSRQHTLVEVDSAGRAWIVPHQTPNGTFRGTAAEEIEPGRRVELVGDEVIRLAASATADVVLYALPN